MKRILRIVVIGPLLVMAFLMLAFGWILAKVFDWLLDEPRRDDSFGALWKDVMGGVRW